MMPTRIAPALLTFITLATASVGSVPILRATSRVSTDTTAFIHVNIIPMDRQRVLFARTLLVAGGRILAIGAVDSIAVPKTARVVNGGDSLFVMPGLVDMHVHLRYPTDLSLLVANGVTTVRNMRGTPWHLDMRKRVAAGEMIGPRIVTAGPIFYGFRGAGATPAEARALVDSQADAGYDFVKVYDRLPQDSYAAVVQEAGVRHLPVAGHVPSGPSQGTGVSQALAYHQASIEHAEQLVYHSFGIDLDHTRIAPLASAIHAAHTAVTPTLVVITSLIEQWEQHDAVLHRPEMRYVEPETYAWWVGDRGHSSMINRTMQPFLDDIVKSLRDSGVTLLAGSDFYLFGEVAGFSLHEELRALVSAGLTPFEALSAATRSPAEYLGESAQWGTIAPGMSADLLVLAANPLSDIHNTTRIAGVMTHGQWLPRARLGQMLDSIANRFGPEQRLVNEWMTRGAEAPSLGSGARPDAAQTTIDQVVTNLTRAKRVHDAEVVATLGTRLRASSAPAWVTLADAYVAAADTTRALETLSHALMLDPANADASAKRRALSQHANPK